MYGGPDASNLYTIPITALNRINNQLDIVAILTA